MQLPPLQHEPDAWLTERENFVSHFPVVLQNSTNPVGRKLNSWSGKGLSRKTESKRIKKKKTKTLLCLRARLMFPDILTIWLGFFFWQKFSTLILNYWFVVDVFIDSSSYY